MKSSGYKVRGCPGSILGLVVKIEKRAYILYIYIVYVLYAYYISYILNKYVELKGSGI